MNEDSCSFLPGAIDVPEFDIRLGCIHIDRKIEIVGHEQRACAGLQNVQSFNDHDVRLANDLKLSLDKLNVPGKEQKELLDIVASTRGVIVEKP